MFKLTYKTFLVDKWNELTYSYVYHAIEYAMIYDIIQLETIVIVVFDQRINASCRTRYTQRSSKYWYREKLGLVCRQRLMKINKTSNIICTRISCGYFRLIVSANVNCQIMFIDLKTQNAEFIYLTLDTADEFHRKGILTLVFINSYL